MKKMCVQSTGEYIIGVALLHASTLCKMSGSEATNYLPKDQLWPIGQSARESRKPSLTSKSTHFENLNKMWSFARDPNLDWYHWGAPGESLRRLVCQRLADPDSHQAINYAWGGRGGVIVGSKSDSCFRFYVWKAFCRSQHNHCTAEINVQLRRWLSIVESRNKKVWLRAFQTVILLSTLDSGCWLPTTVVLLRGGISFSWFLQVFGMGGGGCIIINITD